MRFILVIVASCLLNSVCVMAQAQHFDSTHIYAISMKGSYFLRVDRDMIRYNTSPDVIYSPTDATAIYELVQNTLKGSRISRLKTDNSLDLRLFFQFYRNGKVVEEVGFTSYKTMNIGRKLCSYEIEKLKKLDAYVVGLTKRLGLTDL
jgi:hypothetical protein